MARAGLDRRLTRLETGRRGKLPLLVLWQSLDDPDLYALTPSRAFDGGPSYRRSDFDSLGRSWRLVLVHYETPAILENPGRRAAGAAT